MTNSEPTRTVGKNQTARAESSHTSAEGKSSRPLDLRGISGILCAVAALAILSSVLYFSHFHDFYLSDSPSYVVSAKNLAFAHGFTDAQGYPETFRTPGYPLLIVPFLRLGIDLKYLIVLQHFFRLTIALFATALAFKLSKSRSQALIAGAVVCLDLPTLEGANSVMTETMFAVAIAVVFWLLWKAKENGLGNSFAAGLLAGASILIRPVGIFLFVPAGFYLFLVRKKLRAAAVWTFVLSFACLPFLWAARNYRETGHYTVSTFSGFTMLYFRAGWVLASQDPGDFSANLKKRQLQLEAQVCDEFKRLERGDCGHWSPTDKSQYYFRDAVRILLQHKITYLVLTLKGAARTILGGDAARLAQILRVGYTTAEGILLAYAIPCLSLALIGLWSAWRFNRSFFYLAVLFILYFGVVTAGPEGYSRYRVPIVSIYALVIASGLDFILKRFSARTLASQVLRP